MSDAPILVWFRRDLRLCDNPALHKAVESGRPVILLYIYETNRTRPMGAARQVWLHHSLAALEADIQAQGCRLIRRAGDAAAILDEMLDQSGADTVYWNRRYAQDGRDIDGAIKSDLKSRGFEVESFNANLLSEPWELQTKTGGYYKVFTPYWRATRAQLDVPKPLPAPSRINSYAGALKEDALFLLPDTLNWDEKIMAYHTAGEAGAAARLKIFLNGHIGEYAEQRNRPDDENGTSKLSPHLAHGEISPRQIWHAVAQNDTGSDTFLSEIGWREFSYVLLFHNPNLATENYKKDFDNFEWDMDEQALERWQHGQTGYPFVDAGMRQLWATGWQHNRVRMVCASFLIKHLMIDWRAGEDWYWDTLLEADPAANAASWQWVAGSGADASPYFRIFNPFSQGEKFDPQGDYVRRWVPELKDLPKKFIHQPWTAPKDVLARAGVTLGQDYPKPMVDHKQARERALAAYKASRGEG